MKNLELRDIVKDYEGKPLLDGITFKLEHNETTCLLGASGSGKSTLLRIIAGLEQADGGCVICDGEDISAVPPHRRRFGYVFQDYALFPHLNVAENIAFGLRLQKAPRNLIAERVDSLLAQVNLKGFAKRAVHELSGGEQQRVALARTLAASPQLLLLDEPLAALDESLRHDLLEEIRAILETNGTPAIYVTHDQQEAFAIGDRILLLAGGRIRQDDSPEGIFTRPSSTDVAEFFGLTNRLPGQVVSAGQVLLVSTALGVFSAANRYPPGQIQPGEGVTLAFRRAKVAEAAPAGRQPNTFVMKAVSVSCGPDGFTTSLTDGTRQFTFVLDSEFPAGSDVILITDAEFISVIRGADK